jgi:hypothetical protein
MTDCQLFFYRPCLRCASETRHRIPGLCISSTLLNLDGLSLTFQLRSAISNVPSLGKTTACSWRCAECRAEVASGMCDGMRVDPTSENRQGAAVPIPCLHRAPRRQKPPSSVTRDTSPDWKVWDADEILIQSRVVATLADPGSKELGLSFCKDQTESP